MRTGHNSVALALLIVGLCLPVFVPATPAIASGAVIKKKTVGIMRPDKQAAPRREIIARIWLTKVKRLRVSLGELATTRKIFRARQ